LRFNRFGAALSLLAVSVVLVSGCGESATTSGPSGKSSCGGKKTLTGGGATAQVKAMTRFVNTFEEACPDQTLNYAANGSAAGISEFTSKRTDFAGSDSPLDQNQYDAARERCGSPAWHLPVVFAPIAIAHDVNGVSSLNLNGQTAAKIFTPAGPDAIGISTDAVAKTISGATISGQGNDLVLDPLSFDRPSQPGSYPIVLATYEIACSKYPDAATGTAVKAFLQNAIGAGQKGLADDGNVPLPDDFKSKLSAAINAIA
jgi:ABC-type phosphate transport system substrate-binding protein